MFKETLKSITLSYAQTNPENIKISANNACNKKITQGIFINSFTLSQNKKIIFEKTNTKISGSTINIGALQPGTYKATLSVQNFTKSILFIVPEPSIWLTIKAYALWIGVSIAILCFVIIGIVIVRKKT